MKFLLFFALFSLPLMAQDSIPTLEKMEPLSLRCVGKISHKATPLFMVDGKKYTKLRHKFKKLQPEDIAHIMIFLSQKGAKVFLVREQEMGRYMLSLKNAFQKAEALASNPPNRQLNRKEQHYAEIWEIYQIQQPIVVSGKSY